MSVSEEVVYQECMHNHAARLGLVSLDGCPEYLHGHQDSLLCACCGCHRSFHRKLLLSNAPEIKPKRNKRTKFSLDQKNKMITFADSIAWKPRKDNKEEIKAFCTRINITPKIFFVWLNNNRHRANHIHKQPHN